MRNFVVAGMPRTGSSMFVRGLRQHERIAAYKELLHPLEIARSREHAILRGDDRIWLADGEEPMAFLNAQVYGRPHPGKWAVGYKQFGAFGGHVQPGGDDVFERLDRAVADLHVIHLTRPNHLDSLISWKAASTTGVWALEAGEEPAHQPALRIEVAEAMEYFERVEAFDAWLPTAFPRHRYIGVTYDRLVDDFAEEMGRAFDFLGVGQFAAVQQSAKILTAPTAALVGNLAELETAFAGTRFGRFFRRA